MAPSVEDSPNLPEMEAISDILDKLTLKQLHLMEEKMRGELNIETSINNGSIHLAKTRYIMGHSSVSSTNLPSEGCTDFSASSVCETVEEGNVKQLKIIVNSSPSTVNPIHWFGVLVPQNLHKAQSIFQNTLNYVVECVNVQMQIENNIRVINLLRRFKTLNP